MPEYTVTNVDVVSIAHLLGGSSFAAGRVSTPTELPSIPARRSITVKSNNDEVHLSNASLVADEMAADITLTSNGDMYPESASITAQSGNAADASLQAEDGPTLYVQGMSISDADDTLTYTPEDIIVNGSPSSGSVAYG